MLKQSKLCKLIGVWALLVVCILLLLNITAKAEGVSGIEDLTKLDFTVAETIDGETTTYRFRYKDIGTPEEAVRVDMTEQDGSTLIVILDKDGNKVLVKDIDQTSWTSYPGVALPTMWDKWVRPYMTLPDRRSATWAEIEGEEFLVEGNGRTMKIYDIKINRALEESVFNPE